MSYACEAIDSSTIVFMSVLTDPQIAAMNVEFESLAPADSIRATAHLFGDGAALSTSFGADSMGLIHMATRIKPDMRVIFIDTGWHFPETLEFMQAMTARFKLNLQVFHPQISHEHFVKQHGYLYQNDPDRCCAINKVEPMERAIQGVDCWISGVRRSQASTRVATPNIERRPSGIVKVYPIVRWSTKQIYDYMQAQDLPHHPLWDKGYISIGCAPCTQRIGAGEDERAGRWRGQSKIECGLHTKI